ncbi:unnamed protein product [Lota lota]
MTTGQGKVAVPVPLVLGGQGAVEPLHQPVTLGMEQRRPLLMHPQPPADLTEDLGFIAPLLVAVEFSRDPETGEHLHQPPRGGGGALVRHCIRLRSLREVVHGHEDIAVAGVCDWKWPQHIHPHPLQWGPHQVLLERGTGVLGWSLLRRAGVAAVDVQLHVPSTARQIEPPLRRCRVFAFP